MTPFHGTWWSSKYGYAFSHGSVALNLQEPAPATPYVTPAHLQYLGVYRLWQRSQVQVTVNPDPAEAPRAPHTSPAITVQGQRAPSGDGILTFVVTSKTQDTMKGRYTLTHPEDHGEFELRRGPPPRNNPQCLIA